VATVAAQTNPERGYDHGTFVPLKLIYPDARSPVVQLSLVGSLDARVQTDLGWPITRPRTAA